MPSPTSPATTHIVLQQNIRQLPSDTDTPISLFLRLAHDSHALLLESAEVDGRWGRYSLLGCDILLYLFCRNGLLHLDIRDKRLHNLADCQGLPFVSGVRTVMNRLELRPDSQELSLPPITRALYGYFGYDTAGLFQPKLAKTTRMNASQPEACLVLPGTVLLMDHLYNRLSQASLVPHREMSVPLPEEISTPTLLGPVTSSLNQAAYEAGVDCAKSLLYAGEAIQIVLATQTSAPFSGDPFTLYRRMRRINPSPYMFYLNLPNLTLFGSSPEVLVRCAQGQLQLSPIAGSRRRGADDIEDAELAAELYQDPKDRAEHVMLVDLGRNDLGRIAQPGSVKLERFMEVERFSHIMHLTSRITARLDKGSDALDVLAAAFPAGTVSGAPKLRAMEIIDSLEPVPRGPYAGCVGWLGLDIDSVNLDTGIIIRSMWLRDGVLHWQTGAGIVHDSIATAEWQECQTKSAIMRSVLTQT